MGLRGQTETGFGSMGDAPARYSGLCIFVRDECVRVRTKLGGTAEDIISCPIVEIGQEFFYRNGI